MVAPFWTSPTPASLTWWHLRTNYSSLGTFQVLLRPHRCLGQSPWRFSTPNKEFGFPRLLAILLRYRTYFPDNPIKYLRMDNAKEFKSHTFEDYCTAIGISLKYSVPHEHSQNGLAKTFIKKLQLSARPLLIHAHLPSSTWGHAILHATALLCLCPTLLNVHTPHELLSGQPPNVAHLRIFGCQVWIPVPEP